uniref:Uncharacterized protein n=1 Tax=Eutreptiella gymnastica TaxID=73025 RepID=A0A6U7TPK3_9EUGL|mmetsp:Transcript_112261/g.194945  ORF Transcript_112261/g.194945 Transcript_112261/m.194945 type:complete len:194 (+) Transcript_112261:212-793(+)
MPRSVAQLLCTRCGRNYGITTKDHDDVIRAAQDLAQHMARCGSPVSSGTAQAHNPGQKPSLDTHGRLVLRPERYGLEGHGAPFSGPSPGTRGRPRPQGGQGSQGSSGTKRSEAAQSDSEVDFHLERAAALEAQVERLRERVHRGRVAKAQGLGVPNMDQRIVSFEESQNQRHLYTPEQPFIGHHRTSRHSACQ